MNGNSSGSFNMNMQNASSSMAQMHNQYSSPMVPQLQHSGRNMPQASPNYGYPQQQQQQQPQQQQRLMSINGSGNSQMMGMNQHINPSVGMASGPLPLPHMARQMSPMQAQQYIPGNGQSQGSQARVAGYSPQPDGKIEGGPPMMQQGPHMAAQYKMAPGIMQQGHQPVLSQAQAQLQAQFQRQSYQNAARGPQGLQGPQNPQAQGENGNIPSSQAQRPPQSLQNPQGNAQLPINGLQGISKANLSRSQSAQPTPQQGHSAVPGQTPGLAQGQAAAKPQNQGKPALGAQAPPGQKMTAAQIAQSEMHAKIFRRNLGNAAVVRLIDLVDLVLNEPIENLRGIEFWTRLVQAYFVPNGTIRFSTAASGKKQSPGNSEGLLFDTNFSTPRTYELDTNSAPRFFLSNITSQELATLQLFLTGIKFQVMNNGQIFIVSKLTMNYHYLDGSMGTANGYCRVLLNREFKIDWIDCRIMQYRSTVGLGALDSLWQKFGTNFKGGVKEFINLLTENCQASKTIPNCGLHERAMRTLQTGDMMTLLSPLMTFASNNNIASPLKALEEFTTNSGSRVASGGVANGSVSSPSPRTVSQEDPKQLLKKRRILTSYESPMVSDGRGN